MRQRGLSGLAACSLETALARSLHYAHYTEAANAPRVMNPSRRRLNSIRPKGEDPLAE